MGLDSKKEANFGHYFVCINKLGHRKLIYVILSNESEEYSRLSIGSEERNARGVSLGLFPCDNFINLNYRIPKVNLFMPEKITKPVFSPFLLCYIKNEFLKNDRGLLKLT